MFVCAAILAARSATGHVAGCETVPAAGLHRQTGDSCVQWGNGSDATTTAVGRTGHSHPQAKAR